MLQRKPPGGAVATLARWRKRPPNSDRLAIASRATRILIVKPHDQLGDFVLATPAIQALRDQFPRARLALITREFLAPLARRVKGLDEVWVPTRIDGPTSLASFASLVSRVMRFRPDVAFVMNSVSRSKSADAWASISGARLIVGRSRVFAGSIPADAPQDPGTRALESPLMDALYDLDVEVGRGSRHQTERLMDLVGWCASPVASPRTHLELSDADRAGGRARLEETLHLTSESGSARRVGLHPGAANELKCWPLESFMALGEALAKAEPPTRLAVFDSPRERGRAALVVAELASRGVTAGIVPAGGIGEFAATCSALDLLVCNDSGVMHIAAAVGVPTVSFHSLGDPKEWAPRHDRAVAFYAPKSIATIPVQAALAAARELLSLASP